ncbi:MAG: enoyl-CoA hydratase [Betaproteobacteria bacterium]|nr:enoyl-CoA hydratase [Betaproteobacteria bacterium]
MSATPVLMESVEEGVVTLTMNRPDRRNALNLEMTLAMREALTRAAEDSSVRAVVLTGAGQAFCAGGDVQAMAQGRGQEVCAEERARALRIRAESSRLLCEMPKPTVAVIGGAAAGAGLALALACDFRVAVSGAKITTAFAKVGLSGDFGISYFLPRLVGAARARELMMLSPVLASEEAMALGLIHRVYGAGEFSVQARAFVTTLAQGPTIALGRMKRNLNASNDRTLSGFLDSESAIQVSCFGTEDHKAAAAAFVEKRTPRFLGR